MAGNLLTLAIALLLGLTAATHVFAYWARLDPALGVPLYRELFVAVYAPWQILVWAGHWSQRAPQAFQLPAWVAVLVTGLVLWKGWQAPPTKNANEAAWATLKDLRHADLLGKVGVVVGRAYGRLLRYAGEAHMLVIAPTRRGKTASIVFTTLLDGPRGSSTPESVFIHDPKAELYLETAGYRSQFSRIVYLAPLDVTTDQHNPWASVRLGTDDEIRDIDMITLYLMNPEGKPILDDTSKHFMNLLKQVGRAVFVYGLHSGVATNGAEFNDLVNMPGPVTDDKDGQPVPEDNWENLITVMKAFDHPAVQRGAEVASRAVDREKGSLLTTFANALDLFSDPRIAHMTARSSFPLTALREEETPCSLYWSVPFPEQRRLLPLTRLVFAQLFDHCTARRTGWRHRVRLVMDETPSLGYFEPLMDGLDGWAGLGLQLVIVTPSLRRLARVYGENHNFVEGCDVQVVFGVNDERVARGMSERIGTHTVTKRRVSTTGGRRTTTTEDVKEALLDATGIQKIKKGGVLIKAMDVVTLAHQVRYYERREWLRRSRLPLPERTVHATP